MADHSNEPMTGAFSHESGRPVDAPQTISKRTADKLFVGMMRDQARFGVGRSLLDSRMSLMLSDLRDALRYR